MKTEEKTQVSAVGFEPGTFRSRVAHSIHYATETPPIPDVLLVLVAPKHINRNGTTTLQSRFTPTPTPQATPHSSPKFGLYRFFNSFLQNPYLLTWRIWGIVKTPCILLLCRPGPARKLNYEARATPAKSISRPGPARPATQLSYLRSKPTGSGPGHWPDHIVIPLYHKNSNIIIVYAF